MAGKYTPINVVLPSDALQRCSEELVKQIRENSASNLDADGNKVKADWKQSGKLLDTLKASPEGVAATVDYAEYVNDKYKFAPDNSFGGSIQRQFEDRVSGIIQEAILAEE